MTDDAIADGIVEREKRMNIRNRVQPGPADSSIFHADPGHETIAAVMAAKGVAFVPSSKGPGSRVKGWGAIRRRLKAALNSDREQAHLYVTSNCTQFLRTVPVAPRDELKNDDVDTEAEDHILDETRYLVETPLMVMTELDHRTW
jgi:hypothetical protein